MTQSPGNGPSAEKRSDRYAKVAFLIVAVVVGIAIYFSVQSGDKILSGWPKDLDSRLADANQAGQRVLAFFVSNPANDDTVFVATKTLTKTKNKQAIEAGRFARVKVVINDLKDPTAQKYKITQLPTLLILHPDGHEIARAEGRIGEVPFMEFIQSAGKE